MPANIRNAPYNAVGDGVADDAPAFLAAVAVEPSIYCPASRYRLGAPVPINRSLELFGDGRDKTFISAGFAAGDVFPASAFNVDLWALTFDSLVPRTSGALVNFTAAAAACSLSSFALRGGCIGLRINANNVDVSDGSIRDTVAGSGIGVQVDGGVDLSLRSLLFDSAVGAQPLAGIMVSACADINLIDLNLMHQGTGLWLAPYPGQVVASVTATNSYFDNSSIRGVRIGPVGGAVVRTRFLGCWFGSSAWQGCQIVTGTTPGSLIAGVEFISPQVFLNGGSGILISDAAPKDVKIIGGSFAANGNNGIEGVAGSRLMVHGVDSGANNGLAGNAHYGLYLPGNVGCDDCSIIGNRFVGNLSGPTVLGALGSHSIVANNIAH